MRDVLIDLGELPPRGARPPGPVAGPRPYRFRALLAVLAVVLPAGLAGAAATPPPARPTVVAARLGDMMFVGPDRFFLVRNGPARSGPGAGTKIVSDYALPGGTLRSRTTVPASGAVLDVASAGDAVLASFQLDALGTETTMAVTAGTDVVRWRRPARLLGVSAADHLVLLQENSPRLGRLHWYGIDLDTGQLRWRLEQPDRGYITGTDLTGDFPRRLVVADPAGHLEIRDTVTGRVTASATFPVPADWARRGIALWPDGDLILVGDHRQATAYALADLTPRWTTAVDLYASYVGADCVAQVCFVSPRGRGMLVVDRATGQRRWHSGKWSYADRVGPYLLAGTDAESGGGDALTVIDPATGRVRGDFGRWESLGPSSVDGTVVGLRPQPGDTVFYARLDPARLTTRVLGVADRVSGDCRTTGDVLICRRLDASVAIWPLP